LVEAFCTRDPQARAADERSGKSQRRNRLAAPAPSIRETARAV